MSEPETPADARSFGQIAYEAFWGGRGGDWYADAPRDDWERTAEAVAAPVRAEAVAEWDRMAAHLRSQFPPCPVCGCVTKDDPDARECACDAGCNDGEYAPGINVLLARAAAQGAADLRAATEGETGG